MSKLASTAVVGLVATLALASLAARPAAGSTDAANKTWKIAFVETRNVKPPGARPPGPVFRNRLFVVNADGSGRKLLASSFHVGFDAPSWSPDGRSLAYAKRPGNGGSDSSALFVIDADGGGQRNVSRNPARDFNPAWSPDGRTIAFLRERRADQPPRPGMYHELWVMNAAGSNQRRLTENTVQRGGPGAPPNLSSFPRWSPDSRNILVDRDGNGEIWVMSAGGSEQRNLTGNPQFDGQPAWSPNGRSIVFVSDRDGNGEIYVMNADGSEPRRLTSNAAADFAPTWSPDGRRIVFVSNRDANPEIYMMNADGSGQRRLTRNAGYDESPAWTPDGRIAFASRRTGNWGVYVMNADGSGQRDLTRMLAGRVSYAWSPRRI